MPDKLILHISHANKTIPDQTGYLGTDAELENEVIRLTDWPTEDLFDFAGGFLLLQISTENFVTSNG